MKLPTIVSNNPSLKGIVGMDIIVGIAVMEVEIQLGVSLEEKITPPTLLRHPASPPTKATWNDPAVIEPRMVPPRVTLPPMMKPGPPKMNGGPIPQCLG